VKESTVAIIFSPKTTFPKFSIYNLSKVKPKPTKSNKSEMQSSDINSKKMTEIKYELTHTQRTVDVRLRARKKEKGKRKIR